VYTLSWQIPIMIMINCNPQWHCDILKTFSCTASVLKPITWLKPTTQPTHSAAFHPTPIHHVCRDAVALNIAIAVAPRRLHTLCYHTAPHRTAPHRTVLQILHDQKPRHATPCYSSPNVPHAQVAPSLGFVTHSAFAARHSQDRTAHLKP